MSRPLTFVTALAVIFVLTACNRDQENRKNSSSTQEAQEQPQPEVNDPSAQATAPDPDESLPAEAEEEKQRGLLAASQQDWPTAIKHFESARAVAPKSPELLYDQALAEAKAGNRQLRALALFNAYLSAQPDAPSAAQVNDQIASLEVEEEGVISDLLSKMRDAASQQPEESRSAYFQDTQVHSLESDFQSLGHIRDDSGSTDNFVDCWDRAFYDAHEGHWQPGHEPPGKNDDTAARISAWTGELNTDVGLPSEDYLVARQGAMMAEHGISLGSQMFTDLSHWLGLGPTSERKWSQPETATFIGFTAEAHIRSLDCEEKLRRTYQ